MYPRWRLRALIRFSVTDKQKGHYLWCWQCRRRRHCHYESTVKGKRLCQIDVALGCLFGTNCWSPNQPRNPRRVTKSRRPSNRTHLIIMPPRKWKGSYGIQERATVHHTNSITFGAEKVGLGDPAVVPKVSSWSLCHSSSQPIRLWLVICVIKCICRKVARFLFAWREYIQQYCNVFGSRPMKQTGHKM